LRIVGSPQHGVFIGSVKDDSPLRTSSAGLTVGPGFRIDQIDHKPMHGKTSQEVGKILRKNPEKPKLFRFKPDPGSWNAFNTGTAPHTKAGLVTTEPQRGGHAAGPGTSSFYETVTTLPKGATLKGYAKYGVFVTEVGCPPHPFSVVCQSFTTSSCNR